MEQYYLYKEYPNRATETVKVIFQQWGKNRRNTSAYHVQRWMQCNVTKPNFKINSKVGAALSVRYLGESRELRVLAGFIGMLRWDWLPGKSRIGGIALWCEYTTLHECRPTEPMKIICHWRIILCIDYISCISGWWICAAFYGDGTDSVHFDSSSVFYLTLTWRYGR